MPDAPSIPILELLILVGYLAGTALFGAWFVGRTRTMEAFTLGNRALPGWAVGISILGTYLSSISFLANPGKSYASDWSPFVFSLTLPIACLIAARFFIPFYRNRVQTTAYEHLEQRFGYWARAYAGCSLILLQIGRIAVVLYLVALAVNQLLGWDLVATILLLGVVTIAYTAAGGFEAVIWTDVVQSVVLLGGALLCLLLLLMDVPGGVEQALAVAADQGKFQLGSLDWDFAIQGFWVILLFGIVENLKNFGVDQNYVQRFLAAGSERQALRSLWIGGLTYIPVSALFFLIGTLLFVYYQAAPPADLPAKADQVFPYFIVSVLPSGITGIVIAAVLAAGMSTLDSSLNTSATVWAVDFYKKKVNPQADDKKQLAITRWTTIIIGVIGTTAALAMIQAKTVLDIWWQISAVFGGGMLGLFLLGLLVSRANARSALIATLLGIAVVAWGGLLPKLDETWGGFPFHPLLLGLAGTLTILISGWLLSVVQNSQPDSAEGEGG
jgi:SSS family solute:Na+ symporter